jgi:long-chain acyl-CoA synthetase
VVLLAKNRPEWVMSCLAAIAIGAIVVPLDTQISSDALHHVLRDSQPRVVFTSTDYLNRLTKAGLDEAARTVLLDVAEGDARGWQSLLGSAPAALPPLTPDDGAALFYTSGTTGTPKGVPLSQRNLRFQIDSVLQIGIIKDDDRPLVPLPFYHTYPFTLGLLLPLAAGKPVILPAGLTGPQLLQAVREGGATILVGVPRLYRALLTGVENQAKSGGRLTRAYFKHGMRLSSYLRRRWGLNAGKTIFRPVHQRMGPSLRLLASGGSALDPAVAAQLSALGWDIAIGYGLTETSPLLTVNMPNSGKLDSAGQPLPTVELRIVPVAEGSNGATSDPHGEGEVLARGPGVFDGYRNLPEQTAKAFDQGWFRTGDLGHIDKDGYLYISGRANTLIVTESGKKIQPEPLEELYAQHPVIAEIGVLKAGSALAAVVMPNMDEVNRYANGDVALAVREALATVAQSLPAYQRVGEHVATHDPLPKTNLGKIRRHQLAQLYTDLKAGVARDAAPVGPIAVEDMSEQDRALLDNDSARAVWELLAERYGDRALTPIERIATVRDILREVAAAQATEATQNDPLDDPEAAIAPEHKRWFQPLGPVLLVLNFVLHALNKLLVRNLLRLRVTGLQNVPAHGQIVFTPNHLSYLDVAVIAAALPYRVLRRTYWAGSSDVVFVSALWRLFSRTMQTVPVTRHSGTGRASLAVGALVLKRGNSLVWFPEGKLSTSGELLPFRQGIGLILERYDAQVVPVLVQGTNEALPADNSRLRLRPCAVTFGVPQSPRALAAQGAGPTPAARIANTLHDEVAALRATQSATQQPNPQ